MLYHLGTLGVGVTHPCLILAGLLQYLVVVLTMLLFVILQRCPINLHIYRFRCQHRLLESGSFRSRRNAHVIAVRRNARIVGVCVLGAHFEVLLPHHGLGGRAGSDPW